MIFVIVFGFNAHALSLDGQAYIETLSAMQKKIPALMYHKITDNPSEISDYVVTGEMLRNDFEEIKRRGYSPITVSEYYSLVKCTENLYSNNNYLKIAEFFRKNPNPIILTFDDGYKGIYTHVLPLMREYGFKANFYICGQLIDQNHPEYCTWEEIKLLSQSGLAEIGNHTYSLHSKTKEELNTLYKINMRDAINDINKNRQVMFTNSGVQSNVFSFPYGQYDPFILNMLKSSGYSYFISTDYRVNYLADKHEALGRFNRSAFETTKQFFDTVDLKCKQ